jgi:hypothetical protein
MLMRRDWEWFRHGIAEVLFGKDLDEAYNQGIRIGAEFVTFKIGFSVRNQKHIKLTKTEQRGYDRALELIDAQKPEIAKTTGAMV